MGFVKKMANVAVECARTPGRMSVWSESRGKYVCARDPGFGAALAEQSPVRSHAPIGAAFKLVFLTAFGLTALFMLVCVATTLLAGKEPPELTEKVVDTLLTVVKVGAGAIFGMLGGQSLKG